MAKAKVKFNKKTLVEEMQNLLGGTRVQAEQAVDLVFDTLIARVDNGEQVSISGFGILSKITRKGRKARNPRTGDMVEVPTMFRVKFKPALNFKRIINQAKK